MLNKLVGSVEPTVGAFVIGNKKARYPLSIVAVNLKKASCISSSKACSFRFC